MLTTEMYTMGREKPVLPRETIRLAMKYSVFNDGSLLQRTQKNTG